MPRFEANCRQCGEEFVAETPEELKSLFVQHHNDRSLLAKSISGGCSIFFVKDNKEKTSSKIESYKI